MRQNIVEETAERIGVEIDSMIRELKGSIEPQAAVEQLIQELWDVQDHFAGACMGLVAKEVLNPATEDIIAQALRGRDNEPSPPETS